MKELRRILTGNGASSFISSLMAIAVGLLAGLLILLVSDSSRAPGAFFTILTGGFSDRKSMGQVLYFATPIIMTGLSVGFANRTGLFNIGVSGQFITGAYAAIFIGVKWTFLPGPLHWITALLFAALAGALWGVIPGLLKAYRNVNEVIACIMMNYLGMYLVNFLITKTVFNPLTNQSQRVAGNANLPKMGLDQVFKTANSSSSVGSGIVIAVLAGVLVYIIIEKTKFGYELKACGLGKDAARYAGIAENRGTVLSMAIAGGLSGLGGALLYLAGSGTAISVVDVLAAEGFNGIPVALLGLNNPLGIVFSGLFIAYLTVGGFNMQLFGFANEVIEIITAVIIYFSAFALLFRGFIAALGDKGKSGANADSEGSPGPDGVKGADLR